MRTALVPLAMAALLAAGPVAAHPHVWIVAQAGFRLEAGRVAAVEIAFRFDELLSASLQSDYDQDGDGRFDAAETDRLEREAFTGLAELDWLGRLRSGAQPARLEPPRAFRAELAQGVVTFRFERRLAVPADPRRAAVALTLADPAWYVDVVLDPERPAALLGEVPPGCALGLEADTTLKGYAAPVPPIAAVLACTPGTG